MFECSQCLISLDDNAMFGYSLNLFLLAKIKELKFQLLTPDSGFCSLFSILHFSCQSIQHSDEDEKNQCRLTIKICS
jgi:hypothetical protein